MASEKLVSVGLTPLPLKQEQHVATSQRNRSHNTTSDINSRWFSAQSFCSLTQRVLSSSSLLMLTELFVIGELDSWAAFL